MTETIESRVLAFIIAHLERHGYQPSVREIAEHFRIKSTKTVSDTLASMARLGMIRLGRGRSRGVQLCGFKVMVERVESLEAKSSS